MGLMPQEEFFQKKKKQRRSVIMKKVFKDNPEILLKKCANEG
jgi:hypothetical protein